MDAIGRILQSSGDPGSPAYPRAARECLAQRRRRGQTAPHGAGNAAVGVVKGPRARDQVKDSVLDRGPRQLPGRLPGRLPLRRQAPGPVDDHARYVPALAGAALCRNADVDPATRLVGEPVYFGGGLVAEHGTGPGAQHSRPEPALPGSISGKCRVGTAMHASPRARAKPPVNGFRGEASVAGLLPGR